MQRNYRRPYYPKRSQKPKLITISAGVILLVLAFYIFLAKTNPLLKPEIIAIDKQSASQAQVNLPWPPYGQSAVGAQGHGVLAVNNNNQTPVPTASIAKVMTALAILKAKPLALGEQGPNVPITEADVNFFDDYSPKDGTVTKVVPGERISQYQAMQAMLIRSSNNMADTLVRWAYGTGENYTTFANNYARELGMKKTHFADSSGFSPQTVSTAEDLVILGEQALKHPVIAEIVAQWEANIPEVGRIQNSNLFLDYEGNGVIGIKTGDTDEAGGVYLGAAKYKLENGQTVTVIVAVMSAPNHFAAQKDAMPLLQATRAGFRTETTLRAGETVGRYTLPTGSKVDVVAKKEVSGLGWGNQLIKPSVTLNEIHAPKQNQDQVGTIRIGSSEISDPVILRGSIPSLSLLWRLKYLVGLIN